MKNPIENAQHICVRAIHLNTALNEKGLLHKSPCSSPSPPDDMIYLSAASFGPMMRLYASTPGWSNASTFASSPS